MNTDNIFIFRLITNEELMGYYEDGVLYDGVFLSYNQDEQMIFVPFGGYVDPSRGVSISDDKVIMTMVPSKIVIDEYVRAIESIKGKQSDAGIITPQNDGIIHQ